MAWLMYFQLKIAKVLFVRLIMFFYAFSSLCYFKVGFIIRTAWIFMLLECFSDAFNVFVICVFLVSRGDQFTCG